MTKRGHAEADVHLHIRRDGQRQYQRMRDGRYSWDKRMEPVGRDTLTRQQIRADDRREAKENNTKAARRPKVERAMKQAQRRAGGAKRLSIGDRVMLAKATSTHHQDIKDREGQLGTVRDVRRQQTTGRMVARVHFDQDPPSIIYTIRFIYLEKRDTT